MARRIPKSMKTVNRITDQISREYSKQHPNREKIAKLSTRAGNMLKRMKKR